MYYDQAACPTSHCNFFVLSTSNGWTDGKCLDKGEQMKCEWIYDDVGCLGHPELNCDWHDDIYKCWDKGVTVPCVEFRYNGEQNCPDYCKYQKISFMEGECLSKTDTVACEDYVDSADCDGTRCQWFELEGSYGICSAKGKGLDCAMLMKRECKEAGSCGWAPDGGGGGDPEAGTCTSCPKADCKESTDDDGIGPGPSSDDDGDGTAPCQSFKGDDVYRCPQSRCSLNFPGEDGDGDICSMAGGGDVEPLCIERQCADSSYDAEGCAALGGGGKCVWVADSNTCYTKGSPFPCEQAYAKAECPTGECSWVSDGGGGGGGSDVPEDFGRCLRKGQTMPCSDVWDEADCATKLTTCKWFDALERCVAKDFDPDCTCYNGFGAELCPVTDGKCVLQNGVCSEPGKTVSCNQIPLAASCANSGHCVWNQADYRSVKSFV
jgi:hypothetical protein